MTDLATTRIKTRSNPVVENCEYFQNGQARRGRMEYIGGTSSVRLISDTGYGSYSVIEVDWFELKRLVEQIE